MQEPELEDTRQAGRSPAGLPTSASEVASPLVASVRTGRDEEDAHDDTAAPFKTGLPPVGRPAREDEETLDETSSMSASRRRSFTSLSESRSANDDHEDADLSDEEHASGPYQPILLDKLPIKLPNVNGLLLSEDTPFESIPIATTPSPASIPLPTSPTIPSPTPSARRKSWNNLTLTGSSSTPGPSRPSSAASSRSGISNQIPAGVPLPTEETKPRLHAPPAHPHPFPVPSSPDLNASSSASAPTANGGIGVKGTSTFESVVSRTRPSWLPPKDRVEDDTHLREWEHMMAQSRAAEKEKRKADEARRIEKEKRMAILVPKWETLLDAFSVGKVKDDPALRSMWFDGIPSHMRGRAWALAIGNPLAMSKGWRRALMDEWLY